MPKNERIIKEPDRVSSYFSLEKWSLCIITVSGILYNVGMIAGPWFEGQLVQRILEVFNGDRVAADMVTLSAAYVLTIIFVQSMRFIKRLYVRKFANHINRDMKQVLYAGIIHKSRLELEAEGTGNIMTKAIMDVDTCVEGMRKFTTEVFDTGVVMIAYMAMLLVYDWRLALLSMIFPPLAYIIAEKLKKVVQKSAAEYKASAGRLNAATLDRISNSITYRVYGQEPLQNSLYEEKLSDYEKKAVYSNLWESSMQPIYQIVSMLSLIFILWFGVKNVLGTGWILWNVAAFTTFLSCFTKLAVKSSKAAKLFNAVQKARVSWYRIKPFLKKESSLNKSAADESNAMDRKTQLKAENLSFFYQKQPENVILREVSFLANSGEVIGVTGKVASGKSTFGKLFLGEEPYQGSIQYGGQDYKELLNGSRRMVSYMGHQTELISDTIENNILLGEKGDVLPYLQIVCMDDEVLAMEDGIHTQIGNGGVRLSGGQQARIALARALYHMAPILILDDPFSAVDKKKELQILDNMKSVIGDSIVFLISHRLTIFPQFAKVFWLEHGTVQVSTHEKLLKENKEYEKLFLLQTGGVKDETQA